MTILLCFDNLMPRKTSVSIQLRPFQTKVLRKDLEMGASLRTGLRADIVLRASEGQTNYMIAKELGISRNTVKKWRYRFAREGMAGLESRPIPGRPKKYASNLARFEHSPAKIPTPASPSEAAISGR